MAESDSRRTLLFAPLVGVLLFVSSILGQFVFQQSGNVSSAGGISPTWIQVGLPTLSVLLTGGLVYLYHKQRKLNELEYTADMQVEGHRPTGEGGNIDICVSNLGRGAATDLTLRIAISFPEADECSGREFEATPIKRLEQPNAADARNEWVRPKRNYVGPEQYFVRFWTPVPVKWEDADGDANRTTLFNLASELPDSVDKVRLTIDLDYQGQLGDTNGFVDDLLARFDEALRSRFGDETNSDDGSERIVDDVLPLEPGEDLEFLFSRGMTHDQHERRKASEECDDPFESDTLHRKHLLNGVQTDSESERERR